MPVGAACFLLPTRRTRSPSRTANASCFLSLGLRLRLCEPGAHNRPRGGGCQVGIQTGRQTGRQRQIQGSGRGRGKIGIVTQTIMHHRLSSQWRKGTILSCPLNYEHATDQDQHQTAEYARAHYRCIRRSAATFSASFTFLIRSFQLSPPVALIPSSPMGPPPLQAPSSVKPSAGTRTSSQNAAGRCTPIRSKRNQDTSE